MKISGILAALLGVTLVSAIAWLTQGARQTVLNHVAHAETNSKHELVTVREYLAAYWGAKWPELMTHIPLETLPFLDQLIDPSQIPPWQAVLPEIRAHIREGFLAQRTAWIEGYRDRDRDVILTGAILNENSRPLSQVQKVQLQSIVDRYSTRIEALAAESFDLTAEADEQIWDNGLYSACPLVAVKLDSATRRTGALQLIRSTSSRSWFVSYTIDSSDWPLLADVLAQMSALSDECKQEALACLK